MEFTSRKNGLRACASESAPGFYHPAPPPWTTSTFVRCWRFCLNDLLVLASFQLKKTPKETLDISIRSTSPPSDADVDDHERKEKATQQEPNRKVPIDEECMACNRDVAHRRCVR